MKQTKVYIMAGERETINEMMIYEYPESVLEDDTEVL